MTDPFYSSEGSNFENDFEKLDPLSSSAADMEVSSSSAGASQPAVEDLLGMGEPIPSIPSHSFDPIEPIPVVKPRDPSPEPIITTTSQLSTDTGAAQAQPEKPQAAPESWLQFQGCPIMKGTWLKNVDPKVIELIYWRDPKKTGMVFGGMMVLLVSLALFSVLSVLAYLSLAVLTVTLTFCVYKKVIQAVQKSDGGHPFKQYLDKDIALPEEKVRMVGDIVVKHASCTLQELRRLFMCQDIVDSLKFGLLLWVLTYIGAWFNGITLIILGVVTLFTTPKVYETYQVQIDEYIDLAKVQVTNVLKQVREKIPFPSKKKSE